MVNFWAKIHGPKTCLVWADFFRGWADYFLHFSAQMSGKFWGISQTLRQGYLVDGVSSPTWHDIGYMEWMIRDDEWSWYEKITRKGHSLLFSNFMVRSLLCRDRPTCPAFLLLSGATMVRRLPTTIRIIVWVHTVWTFKCFLGHLNKVYLNSLKCF